MNLITCPSCKNECSPLASSCPKCGHPFESKQVSSTPNTETGESNNKWKLLTLIGSAVVLVLLSVLAFNLFFRESNTVSTGKNSNGTSSAASSQTGWFSDSASLSIDAALVFKSGDVKPVARTEFTLLDRDLESILKDSNYTSELPSNLRDALERMSANVQGSRAKTFALILSRTSTAGEGDDPQAVATLQFSIGKALSAVKPHVLYSTTSDFQGKAKFENLKPGKYYLFGYSKLGNSAAVWNIETVIKDGENKITLDNGNAQSL